MLQPFTTLTTGVNVMRIHIYVFLEKSYYLLYYEQKLSSSIKTHQLFTAFFKLDARSVFIFFMVQVLQLFGRQVHAIIYMFLICHDSRWPSFVQFHPLRFRQMEKKNPPPGFDPPLGADIDTCLCGGIRIKN